MLDIHAKMLFVASRINAATRSTGKSIGTTEPDNRINHVSDRVRLVSPRKQR